jgi:hypothetical protein
MKVAEHKMCFDFPYISLRNIPGFKKKSAKYYHVFMLSTNYSCILVRFQSYFVSRQIFEKYWNIKFHENQTIGSPSAPCRRTDRREEVYGRFSKFCERA